MTTTRADFLAERRTGIGGSDVAAIMGFDPWREPLDVWREKVLGDESRETPGMRRGRIFEAPVLAKYAALTGAKLLPLEGPIRDGWRIGNLDGIARIDGWNRGVEVKTQSSDEEWGEPGTDDVPVYYQTQAQWYMDLAHLEEFDFPIVLWPSHAASLRNLIGLTPAEIVDALGISVYSMQYNATAAKQALEECERFWRDHVLTRVPPLPRSPEAAGRNWYSVAGKSVPADDRVIELLREYDAIREEDAEIKTRRERVKFQLSVIAGEADAFVHPGTQSTLATLKTTIKRPYTVAATKFKTLNTTKWWSKFKESR